MSRRSVELRRKAAQFRRVHGRGADTSVLIPDRVVKSRGNTKVKLPVRDRETKEIVDFRLEDGIPSTAVVTYPADREARKWREIL